MAVPYCIWMASMALTTDGRSTVACCATWAVPAKVTRPTSMCGGTVATKALAASCAATMRVGLTSCTRMLREMSMASRMVDLDHGSANRAVGRDSPSISRHSATNTSAGGTCRRQRGPAAALATATLGSRSARLPRRRSSHR